jgi:hypothetical protein
MDRCECSEINMSPTTERLPFDASMLLSGRPESWIIGLGSLKNTPTSRVRFKDPQFIMSDPYCEVLTMNCEPAGADPTSEVKKGQIELSCLLIATEIRSITDDESANRVIHTFSFENRKASGRFHPDFVVECSENGGSPFGKEVFLLSFSGVEYSDTMLVIVLKRLDTDHAIYKQISPTNFIP